MLSEQSSSQYIQIADEFTPASTGRRQTNLVQPPNKPKLAFGVNSVQHNGLSQLSGSKGSSSKKLGLVPQSSSMSNQSKTSAFNVDKANQATLRKVGMKTSIGGGTVQRPN